MKRLLVLLAMIAALTILMDTADASRITRGGGEQSLIVDIASGGGGERRRHHRRNRGYKNPAVCETWYQYCKSLWKRDRDNYRRCMRQRGC